MRRHCGESFEVGFVTPRGRTVAPLTLRSAEIRSMADTEIGHTRELADTAQCPSCPRIRTPTKCSAPRHEIPDFIERSTVILHGSPADVFTGSPVAEWLGQSSDFDAPEPPRGTTFRVGLEKHFSSSMKRDSDDSDYVDTDSRHTRQDLARFAAMRASRAAFLLVSRSSGTA